jgi:molecular chaperone DnaK
LTSDLTPYVLGKVLNEADRPAIASVEILRGDGQWRSPPVPLSAEGAFLSTVQVLPRRSARFELVATDKSGKRVAVRPAALEIVHGLTISDPPLSRTIGVALADDTIRVYFERGAPLPARRTFRLHTVEALGAKAEGSVLRIPVVQGELDRAHLCRLVGVLEISGAKLRTNVPANTLVELTLEVDRGGKLSGRATIPSVGQVFEDVVQLLVEQSDPRALEEVRGELQGRLARLRASAFRRADASAVARLGPVERLLVEVERDVEAARGGDADAAQKARRVLLEADAALEVAELEVQWPDLEQEAIERLTVASSWISELGTEQERRVFSETWAAIDSSRAAKHVRDVQRHLRVVDRLADAAFFRHPEAWGWLFESAASRVGEATDVARAQKCVDQGAQAKEKGETDKLRRAVQELWTLLPPDARERRLSFDSGLR